MNLTRTLLFSTIFSFSFCVNSHAFVTQEGQYGGKNSQDKSLQQQKTINKKSSAGERKSEKTSEGKNLSESEAKRKAKQIINGVHFSVELSPGAVFFGILAKWEKEKSFFQQCQVVTSPRTLSDFGLGVEQNGMINSTQLNYYSSAASSFGKIADHCPAETAPALSAYKQCLIFYGGLTAQAGLNLLEDLNDLGVIARDNETIKVTGLALEDLNLVAEGSLIRSLNQIKTGKTPIARETQKAYQSQTPCNFGGNLETYTCGEITFSIAGGRSVASLNQVPWFSENQVGGFKEQFKIDKGWSFSQALEILAQSQSFKNTVADIDKYSDELTAKGMTKQAIQVQRDSVDLLLQGRTNINPMGFAGIGN
jgi:hypothetical protein